MADVVKVNIYLQNIADINDVDAVYTNYFPSGVPARRIVGVSSITQGALIQMDVVLANAEGTPPKA